MTSAISENIVNIFEDINKFLISLDGDEDSLRLKFIGVHVLGYGTNQKGMSYKEVGIKIVPGKTITKQRVEVLFKEFIKGLINSLNIKPQQIKQIIDEALSKNINLDVCFSKIYRKFINRKDFYIFLEIISELPKQLAPYLNCLNIKIFDKYIAINPLPIMLSTVQQIIMDVYKINLITTKLIIVEMLTFKNITIDNNMVDFKGNPYKSEYISVTSMISFSTLELHKKHPEEKAFKYNQIKDFASNYFGYPFAQRAGQEIVGAMQLGYIYLYGDSSARHISLFNESIKKYAVKSLKDKLPNLQLKYYFDEIDLQSIKNEILIKMINFLSKNSPCLLNKVIIDCFNEEIEYYDLRFIINEYIQKSNIGNVYPIGKLFFNGKSDVDIVSLNIVEHLNFTSLVLEYINEIKSCSKEELLSFIKPYKKSTFETVIRSLVSEKEIIEYPKDTYKTKGIIENKSNVELEKHNQIIEKIKDVIDVKEFVTINYIEEKLNEKFNYSHDYYKGIILKYFTEIYCSNGNLLFKRTLLKSKEKNPTIASIVKEYLIKYNNDKILTKTEIKNKILCTEKELTLAINTILNKGNT